MKKIVEKEGIGVISETFDFIDLAKELNNLSNEEIMRFKLKSHKAAPRYSSLQNDQVFASILDQADSKVQARKNLAF